MPSRLETARARAGAKQVELDAFELRNGCNPARMSAETLFAYQALCNEVAEANMDLRCAEHEEERRVHIPGTSSINKPTTK